MTIPPCPLCSFFKRRHPDVLLSDVIEKPDIRLGERSHRWFISGCIHARTNENFETAEAAIDAWAAVAESLYVGPEKTADLAEYVQREGRLLTKEAE